MPARIDISFAAGVSSVDIVQPTPPVKAAHFMSKSSVILPVLVIVDFMSAASNGSGLGAFVSAVHQYTVFADTCPMAHVASLLVIAKYEGVAVMVMSAVVAANAVVGIIIPHIATTMITTFNNLFIGHAPFIYSFRIFSYIIV
jgi:hypothetical protein